MGCSTGVPAGVTCWPGETPGLQARSWRGLLARAPEAEVEEGYANEG